MARPVVNATSAAILRDEINLRQTYCFYRISLSVNVCKQKQGRRPRQKSRGDKKMNQILGYYDAFLFPFILSHPLLFVPPSLKPVLCS